MHKESNPFRWLCLFALLSGLLNLVPGNAAAQTLLLYEGFENRQTFTNKWTVENLYSEDDPTGWAIVGSTFGGEGTRSGTNKIYCAGVGYGGSAAAPYYPDNMGSSMWTTVNLSNVTTAYLSFIFKYKIFLGNEENGFDEVMTDYMTIYVDGERVWGTDEFDIFAEPGDPSAPPVGWTLKTLDLSRFAGDVRVIRFDFESDFSGQEDQMGQGEGIYLDDITVAGTKVVLPDFDQNGYYDITWQNTNGSTSVWFMNDFGGGYDVGSAQLLRARSLAPVWNVVAQNDFDGDGHSDFLWQNFENSKLVIWYMTNATFLRAVMPTKQPALNWRVVGTADFDNNLKRDYVFQNLSDGRLAAWFMNGADFVREAAIKTNIVRGSFVVAVSDFNFDGHEDLLVERASDGFLHFKYLKSLDVGVNRATEGFNAGLRNADYNVPNPWRVKAAADVDADGSLDLITHNKNTRQTRVWYMNGWKILRSGEPINQGRPSNLGWQIVAPK